MRGYFLFFFLIFSLNISPAFADQSYLSGVAGMIAQSTAEEALTALNDYKTQVETCLSKHPTTAYTDCAGSKFSNTTYFSYALAPDSLFVDNATYSTDNYKIIATPTAAANALAGSVIIFIRNNGSFTCQASGSYAGVC